MALKTVALHPVATETARQPESHLLKRGANVFTNEPITTTVGDQAQMLLIDESAVMVGRRVHLTFGPSYISDAQIHT